MSNDINRRVTITYSVDLQEVPSRAQIMLKELSSIFKNLSNVAEEAASEVKDNALQGLKKIDKLSILTGKTKTRIEDIASITTGYIEILREIAESQEKPKKKKVKKKKKESS